MLANRDRGIEFQVRTETSTTTASHAAALLIETGTALLLASADTKCDTRSYGRMSYLGHARASSRYDGDPSDCLQEVNYSMPGLMKTRTAYIHAPLEEVWRALTDPALTVQYVGGRVQSTWQPGDEVVYLAPDSDIRLFEGHLLEVEPMRKLVLRCRWLFAPELAADKPHREIFELEAMGPVTRLTATFDEYEDDTRHTSPAIWRALEMH